MHQKGEQMIDTKTKYKKLTLSLLGNQKQLPEIPVELLKIMDKELKTPCKVTMFITHSSSQCYGWCKRDCTEIRLKLIVPKNQDQYNNLLFLILHEVAHANTPGHIHDKVWRREAIRLYKKHNLIEWLVETKDKYKHYPSEIKAIIKEHEKSLLKKMVVK